MLSKRLGVIGVLIIALAGCTAIGGDAVKRVVEARQQADELYRAEQYEQALIHYRTVTRLLPDQAHAWLRLGNCHARLSRYRQAVEAYEQALVLDPELAAGWINLSYVRAQLLAETVAEMYQRVPQDDPQVERVHKMVESVLAPFSSSPESSSATENLVPGRPSDNASP